MSLAVLDLNDASLTLGDIDGIRARSPGFALLAAEAPLLGEAARSKARIDPRSTNSQFWLRLGTEPLHHAPVHTRHNADLGYRHLLQVHELAGQPAELLLAVPGSFSREQLAMLLGIAERCPFRACGLVDSAIAAASTESLPGAALHLELQLHQTVLTRIEHADGMLARGAVRALPGTGLAALQDRWARRAAESFIRQSRFDPLHAAATEQQLHDRLPGWLEALASQDTVEAELQQQSNRYRATLRAGEMLEAVQSIYADLLEALAREGTNATLLLGARAAGLPRFAERVPEARALADDAAIRGALRHAALVRSEERALRFVTRLPAEVAAASVRVPTPANPPATRAVAPAPTHLVSGGRALRLDTGTLYLLGNGEEGWELSRIASSVSRCRLEQDGTDWYACAVPGVLLRIDGLPAPGRVRVAAGTRLGIESDALVFVTEVAADVDGA